MLFAPVPFAVNGVVRITDPSFDRDDENAVTVPAQSGRWIGGEEVNGKGEVTRLCAWHESVAHLSRGWLLADLAIGCASGAAGFFDDKFYVDDADDVPMVLQDPSGNGIGVVTEAIDAGEMYHLFKIMRNGVAVALMLEFQPDEEPDNFVLLRPH